MIQYVRIQNFKAIRDSKKIKFQELNAFIGNNGTGKSSVIEALQLLQDLVLSNDFTEVFKKWGGLEKIRNQYSNIDQLNTNNIWKTKLKKNKFGIERTHLPISIEISAKIENKNFKYEVHLNTTVDGNFYQNEYECLVVGNERIYEDAPSFLTDRRKLDAWSFFNTEILELKQNKNKVCNTLLMYIASWQFLNLNAHLIGLPLQVNKSLNKKKLKSDGSNLSEIIKQEFKTREEFSIVIEKLKYVLPYVTDIQTSVSTEIADTIFLEMTESGKFKIPGWLFSSGTVRVLTILVELNKENPPSVLFIEEIENGLDPRTINMLLSEIQASLEYSQFVMTTHSPYLLDLLALRHLILVEKDQEKGTIFIRPEDNEKLKGWKEKFSPGQLYLMDRLGKK